MKLVLRDLTSSSTAKRPKASKFDVYEGLGSPEAVVTGKIGDVYVRRDGSSGTTIYFKESGHVTNTGWVARGTGGGGGWQAQEIFAATQGQTVFVLTLFTIAPSDKISVYVNGVEYDEGAGYDYTVDYGTETITFNTGRTAGARVKIRKW